MFGTIGTIIAGGIAGYVSAWIAFHFGTKRDLQRIREEFDHRLREQQDKQSIAVEDEAWDKLHDAQEAVKLVYASVRSYPDLDRITPEELDEFLKNSFLTPVQQDDIRRATRKTELLSQFVSWKEVFDASTKGFAVRDYVVRKVLYLPRPIADDFLACAKHLLDAVNDYQTWRQLAGIRPESSIRKEGARSLGEAMKLSTAIEAKLRQRREVRKEA